MNKTTANRIKESISEPDVGGPRVLPFDFHEITMGFDQAFIISSVTIRVFNTQELPLTTLRESN